MALLKDFQKYRVPQPETGGIVGALLAILLGLRH